GGLTRSATAAAEDGRTPINHRAPRRFRWIATQRTQRSAESWVADFSAFLRFLCVSALVFICVWLRPGRAQSIWILFRYQLCSQGRSGNSKRRSAFGVLPNRSLFRSSASATNGPCHRLLECSFTP